MSALRAVDIEPFTPAPSVATVSPASAPNLNWLFSSAFSPPSVITIIITCALWRPICSPKLPPPMPIEGRVGPAAIVAARDHDAAAAFAAEHEAGTENIRAHHHGLGVAQKLRRFVAFAAVHHALDGERRAVHQMLRRIGEGRERRGEGGGRGGGQQQAFHDDGSLSLLHIIMRPRS